MSLLPSHLLPEPSTGYSELPLCQQVVYAFVLLLVCFAQLIWHLLAIFVIDILLGCRRLKDTIDPHRVDVLPGLDDLEVLLPVPDQLLDVGLIALVLVDLYPVSDVGAKLALDMSLLGKQVSSSSCMRKLWMLLFNPQDPQCPAVEM